MPEYARTRADVDLRAGPAATTGVMDRFPTDCQVEILETQDGWHKIQAVRLKRSLKGFVPHVALIFPPADRPPIFPTLNTVDGEVLPAVPPTLPLADFQQWQSAGGRPGWLAETTWAALTAEQQAALSEAMLASINQDPARWQAWLDDVTGCGRLTEARMDEWIVMLEGGREVYAIRDHYVYRKPVQDANYHGCAMKGQMMLWTGKMRCTDENGTLRRFYEVSFYRMSREMRGWFRADLADRYVYPTPEIDTLTTDNAEKVFNLARPILRHPQDHEMTDAKAMRYTGAQYINLLDVLNRPLRHFCLCGEFCVAALAGRDIIPVLQEWIKSGYWRVNEILGQCKEGTGAGDLQSLLRVVGLKGDAFSSMPTTLQQIKERLQSGQFAIAGCRITSGGKVKPTGTILHWVIVEDVLPVGNSGWVRIYNPFNNCEEVYTYELFLASGGGGMGLWVTGGKPIPEELEQGLPA